MHSAFLRGCRAEAEIGPFLRLDGALSSGIAVIGNDLSRAMREISQTYSGALVLPFSAKTGAGKDELWNCIRGAVEKFSIRENSA